MTSENMSQLALLKSNYIPPSICDIPQNVTENTMQCSTGPRSFLFSTCLAFIKVALILLCVINITNIIVYMSPNYDGFSVSIQPHSTKIEA